MTPSFSDDDVGKRAETPSGEAIGYVVAVDDDAVHVEPDPSALDSIRATLGVEGDEDEALAVPEASIADVTDDAIRLRAPSADEGPAQGGHDSVIERDEDEPQRDHGSSTGVMTATEAAGSTDAAESAGADATVPGESNTTDAADGPSTEDSARDGTPAEPDAEPADTDRTDAGERDRDDQDETHLDRAREELMRASDAADRPVQEHLDSVQLGVFEERDGDLTREEPAPKDDRIDEVAEKLDGLAAETSGEVRDRIRRGRDHLRDYLEAR